jgi:hypothetical protein
MAELLDRYPSSANPAESFNARNAGSFPPIVTTDGAIGISQDRVPVIA